jgi:4-hydroxy-3-polyprenylbenzoate decarboxylase
VGRLLARLKEPEPPQGLKDAGKLCTMAKAVWDMKPSHVRAQPACQEVVLRRHGDVDLARLPMQTCWPGDAAR